MFNGISKGVDANLSFMVRQLPRSYVFDFHLQRYASSWFAFFKSHLGNGIVSKQTTCTEC